MKSTGILVKTSALILGFTLVLGVGILSLSFSHGGALRNEDTFLTPEHAVAPPTAQELLQKKFDAYNSVTEENGKRVVTIFSEEQVADIRARREKGEWFWLSSEEMLFLINDTVKLFDTYDTVCVWSLDGTQSFFDCNVKEKERECAITDVILLRTRALNSAETPRGSEGAFLFFSDIKQPLSEAELSSLSELTNLWKDDTETKSVAQWDFIRRESYAHIHYSSFVSEAAEYLRLIEHYYIPLE